MGALPPRPPPPLPPTPPAAGATPPDPPPPAKYKAFVAVIYCPTPRDAAVVVETIVVAEPMPPTPPVTGPPV